MKSLMAIGSDKEADFYAKIFQSQQPERFALVVIDPRCLNKPLLDVLISNLKILSDLGLTPTLLVGALNEDRTKVQSQSYRLCQALNAEGIPMSKLNCASYQFFNGVRKIINSRRIPVLEMTEKANSKTDLRALALDLKPFKVLFLQPSGGFRVDGKRLAVVNIDRMEEYLDAEHLSSGQTRFVAMVGDLASDAEYPCTYVIASPLNLLAELFTVKGAGTMLRRGANIVTRSTYNTLDVPRLKSSIEGAFGRTLQADYFKRSFLKVHVEENYRGGAIVSQLAGLPYLSKFWVSKEAQGEGIAFDVWQGMEAKTPEFFWRSHNSNPFNDWYMKMCDGMQLSGNWRVFWKGLEASEMPTAILAASSSPIDFESE